MDIFRHHPILMHLLSFLGDIPRQAQKAPRAAGPISTVAQAHEDLARLAGTETAILRDTGMSAEDAMGIKAYQPALPFFMQSGFR